MRRNVYTDGWKTPWKGEKAMFLVEHGKLVRGVLDGKSVYPYDWNSKLHCYVNVSGIIARYGIFDKVVWY